MQYLTDVTVRAVAGLKIHIASGGMAATGKSRRRAGAGYVQ
jgi:hypothetical protein